jgi:hypothetical protein
MRSFVVNANERHRCGDDILHRFGPPALGLNTFRRTGSQAGWPGLTSGCHVVAKGGKQSFDLQIDADLRRDRRHGWQPLRQHPDRTCQRVAGGIVWGDLPPSPHQNRSLFRQKPSVRNDLRIVVHIELDGMSGMAT